MNREPETWNPGPRRFSAGMDDFEETGAVATAAVSRTNAAQAAGSKANAGERIG